MNMYVKTGLAAGVGCLLGIFLGAALTKKKYEQLADNEISEYKKYYDSKLKKKDQKTFTNKTTKQSSYEEFDPEYVALNSDYIIEQAEGMRSLVNDKAEKNVEETMAEREHPTEEDSVPYEISDSEFINGYPNYDKVSITYYDEDLVVADDLTNEMIVDPEKLIGEDYLHYFSSGDDDVIYIRNDKISTDFELTRYEGSFSKDILGIKEEE